MPSPPKGHNSKFYTPWRGVYHVMERTSPLTYIVKKQGGRKRKAHVNRLKFYNPMDPKEDPLVKISVEDDEKDPEENITHVGDDQQNDPHIPFDIIQPKNNTKNYQGRITRSKTNSLPQQISRFHSSSVYHPANKITNTQYPWAHNHLRDSLKQVKILT